MRNVSLKNGEQGFTLIEMSVVLIIIALLAGSIFVGQTLLRQSQINGTMADAQRYIAATNTFAQKYNALPGDMPNATSYWGAQSSCPTGYGSPPAVGTLTCNGDGNGMVYAWSSAVSSGTNYAEEFTYWQHLAIAGMIPGTYTAAAGPTLWIDSVPGVNIPAGRLNGMGIGIIYLGDNAPAFFSRGTMHVYFLGGREVGMYPANAILTTDEAQSFDSKYDDGSPATGNVFTFSSGSGWGNTSGCTTNNGTANVYNVAMPGIQCALILATGF